MRSLYLTACLGMQVVYDEPALVVCSPEKTNQLFPLVRISNVIVTGFVEWSTEAFLACGEAGVSVVFLDGDGKVKGRWSAVCSSQYAVLESVFQRLGQPRSEIKYRNWLNGMRRLAVRSAARRLGFTDWRNMDSDALNFWSVEHLGVEWQAIRHWLEGALNGWVLHQLQQFGLNAEVEQQLSICLVDDLAGLLVVDFLPMLFAMQRQNLSLPCGESLAGLLEGRKARLENLLNALLSKLHDCFTEIH